MPGLRNSFHKGRGGRHATSRKEHPNVKSTYVKASSTKPTASSTPSPASNVKPAGLRHPHSAKPAATAPPTSILTAPTAPVSLVAMDDDADHFVRGRQPRVQADASATATTHKRPLSEQLFRTKPDADEPAVKAKKNRKRSADSPLLDIDTSTKRSKSARSASNSVHVEILTYRHLYVGMTLLGCVKRVDELELLVALPNGHTGHLALREISTRFQQQVDDFIAATSDEADDATAGKGKKGRAALPNLHSLFRVGQLLPVSVLTLTTPTQARRVELTLLLPALHTQLTASGLAAGQRLVAVVASVEEKGYVMELGVGDAQVRGFLAFGEAPVQEINSGVAQDKKAEKSEENEEDEEEEEEARLVLGQPVLCVVLSLSARAVVLSAKPSLLRSTVSVPNASQHLLSLLPSSRYTLSVTSLTPTGLLCSGPTFTASVDLSQLPSVPSSSTPLTSLYRVGQQLTATLLYVNKATKVAACSLKERLVEEGEGVEDNCRQGDWVSAKVWRVEAKVGVYFECRKVQREAAFDAYAAGQAPSADSEDGETKMDDEETASFISFAPLTRLADEKVENVEKRFRLNTLHYARVLSFDPLSSLHQLTLQPSTLSLPIMSIDDVHAGQLVTGTVLSHEKSGVLVSLAPHVRALVPALHYADVHISDPRKTIKLHSKVKARVLHVDPSTKHVLLTLKKQLVTSPHPTPATYREVKEGMLLHGFVSSVDGRYGLVVEFYERVHGLVSVKGLVREGYVEAGKEEDVSAVWKKGDVVCVRVLSVQPGKRKLYLSLKLKDDRKERKEAEAAEKKRTEEEKADDHTAPHDNQPLAVGAVLNGRVTRYVKGSGFTIALPHGAIGRVHMCDASDEWVRDLAAAHKAGSRVKVRVLAMVKDDSGKKTMVDLTMKSSLVEQVSQSRHTLRSTAGGIAACGFVMTIKHLHHLSPDKR